MARGKEHTPVRSAMPKMNPRSGLTCPKPGGKVLSEKSRTPTSKMVGGTERFGGLSGGYGGIDKGTGRGGGANR
jgi:hypothetical protein